MRQLEEDSCVWDHNSWDDVPWDEEKAMEAESKVSAQLAASPHLAREDIPVDLEAESKWNAFYSQHNRWFFKDRNWLSSEFPELFQSDQVILEVGCGAGNTMWPILRETNQTMIHGCDISQKAVDLVKGYREFDPTRMTCFQHDLGDADQWFDGLAEGSVDVVVLIFVLSALHPDRLPTAISKLYRVLKPGGLILFRDYGRLDLTQLRFKPDRLIRPDLYLRGDGTAVHYFTTEELDERFTAAGFKVISNEVDRRLLVNRFRRLTMYRVWMQAKFQK